MINNIIIIIYFEKLFIHVVCDTTTSSINNQFRSPAKQGIVKDDALLKQFNPLGGMTRNPSSTIF